MVKIIKAVLPHWAAAFLFAAGIVLAGSESKHWPWNVVAGVVVFAAAGIMAVRLEK